MDNVDQITRINILIPVYNSGRDLDLTVDSIRQQKNFSQAKIYITIVDFGSTDGTYEKALTYGYHTGVYRPTDLRRGKSMAAIATKFWSEMHPGDLYTFDVLITPGDIIYPDFLYQCTRLMLEYSRDNPVVLVCETDIRLASGEIRKQFPLFKKTGIVDGKAAIEEYFNRGALHNIFCFGGAIQSKRHRNNRNMNERIWWSKLFTMALDRNVLYTGECLACIKERFYQDELEEILLRWENVILSTRQYKNLSDESINGNIECLAAQNLSCYSIWRSYLLYGKGMKKEAEDCLIISEIINPDVIGTEVNNKMWRYLKNGALEDQNWLKQFFLDLEEKTIEEMKNAAI